MVLFLCGTQTDTYYTVITVPILQMGKQRLSCSGFLQNLSKRDISIRAHKGLRRARLMNPSESISGRWNDLGWETPKHIFSKEGTFVWLRSSSPGGLELPFLDSRSTFLAAAVSSMAFHGHTPPCGPRCACLPPCSYPCISHCQVCPLLTSQLETPLSQKSWPILACVGSKAATSPCAHVWSSLAAL